MIRKYKPGINLGIKWQISMSMCIIDCKTSRKLLQQLILQDIVMKTKLSAIKRHGFDYADRDADADNA